MNQLHTHVLDNERRIRQLLGSDPPEAQPLGGGAEQAALPPQRRLGLTEALWGSAADNWDAPSFFRYEDCYRCSVMAAQIAAVSQSLAGLGASLVRRGDLPEALRYAIGDLVYSYIQPCRQVHAVLDDLWRELLDAGFGDPSSQFVAENSPRVGALLGKTATGVQAVATPAARRSTPPPRPPTRDPKSAQERGSYDSRYDQSEASGKSSKQDGSYHDSHYDQSKASGQSGSSKKSGQSSASRQKAQKSDSYDSTYDKKSGQSGSSQKSGQSSASRQKAHKSNSYDSTYDKKPGQSGSSQKSGQSSASHSSAAGGSMTDTDAKGPGDSKRRAADSEEESDSSDSSYDSGSAMAKT